MYGTILAVLTTTILQFVLGMMWYSPSVGFGKKWLRYVNLDKEKVEQVQTERGGAMYGFVTIAMLVQNIVLAQLVSTTNVILSVFAALVLWLGFVAPTQISGVLFSSKDPRVIYIDTTYQLANLVLGALVYTFWPLYS
jgi:hypothetical protein